VEDCRDAELPSRQRQCRDTRIHAHCQKLQNGAYAKERDNKDLCPF
jgi:hypothetical protein